MKTSNKVLTAVLLTAVLTAGGCKDSEILLTPELPETAAFVIIDGDTVKTLKTKDYDKIYKYDNNSKKYITVGDTVVTYKEPKLHTPPAKDPDLVKIKNDKEPTLKGKPLSMIVVGGSLSAGVKDGGYFNEGILTSYPNLIARQMKLKKFEQPLFDKNEYNGVGRRIKTGFNPTKGPVQKFNAVQNNLAGEYQPDEQYDSKKIKLKDYKGDPDNLAVPFHTRSTIKIDGATNSFDDRIVTIKNSFGYNLSTTSYLKTKKFDFFIVETGIDDLMRDIDDGSGALMATLDPPPGIIPDQDYTFYETLTFDENRRLQPELKLIREVFDPLGAKGVFLNVPDVLDFPYFIDKDYVFNYDPVIKQELLKYYRIDLIKKFKPSSRIDSLLSREVSRALKPVFNTNNKLQSGDFLVDSRDAIKTSIERMNGQLISFNKKYGYGIVDIRTLYKKVLSSSGFIADDGTKINVSNFFSNDGVNPTPLGQAVIANEVIKTINQTYKVNVPLISVREYANQK